MTTNYNVLYVEDDLDDLTMVSDAFEEYAAHLRVVHAQNGIEALQVLQNMSQESNFPCLIILDINMPVMDGRRTLLEIKKDEKYRHIPVAMFSTSKSTADKKFAEELGAAFFTKPSTYLDLQNLVTALVQKCILEKRA